VRRFFEDGAVGEFPSPVITIKRSLVHRDSA